MTGATSRLTERRTEPACACADARSRTATRSSGSRRRPETSSAFPKFESYAPHGTPAFLVQRQFKARAVSRNRCTSSQKSRYGSFHFTVPEVIIKTVSSGDLTAITE